MDPSAPSFSLLNSSDSQGWNSSDSPSSLPSEPPEIRKWFSSYVYESPELNIGEELECAEGVRGNDCEKEGNDVTEKNDKWKEAKLRELGKVEEKDFLFDGDENLESKGFVRCKNASGRSYILSQVSGHPDTLLCSEPPDIRNWFSSYAYESPALGSSDGIDLFDCKDNIFDIEGHVTEVTRTKIDSKGSSRIGRNDDFVSEQMVSSGDNKSKRSLETIENEHAH